MQEFLIYNIKVAACLAVFYLFYKLLLSRDTFHRVNRVVLLLVMALAFVLPLCIITVHRQAPVQQEAAVGDDVLTQLLASGALTPEMLNEMVVDGAVMSGESTATKWGAISGIVFIIGAALVLLFVMISVFRVLGLIRSGEHERIDRKAVLVKKKEEVMPFSWLKYIVISRKDLAESGEQIISHEKAHIELRHSLDLMLADVVCCLQWFNPAMWLLRRELTAIHEYEADRAVLASGADPKKYQMLLIKKAVGAGRYSIANSLNHSKLKNRITMMLQKRSAPEAKAKILLLLPLVCLALTAFARTEYIPVEDKVNEKNETGTTVVEMTADKPEPQDRPKVVRIKAAEPLQLESSVMVLEDGTRVEIHRGTIQTTATSDTLAGKRMLVGVPDDGNLNVTVREVGGRKVVTMNMNSETDGDAAKVRVRSFAIPAGQLNGDMMNITVDAERLRVFADSVAQVYTFSMGELPEGFADAATFSIDAEKFRLSAEEWERFAAEHDGQAMFYSYKIDSLVSGMGDFKVKTYMLGDVDMESLKNLEVDVELYRAAAEQAKTAAEDAKRQYRFHIREDGEAPRNGSPRASAYTIRLDDEGNVTDSRALPEPVRARIRAKAVPAGKMTIELDRRGKITIEGRPVVLDELQNVVAEIAVASGNLVTDYEYAIEASPKTKLEAITNVKGKLRGMGVPVRVDDPTQ